jgi:hypothetical protein
MGAPAWNAAITATFVLCGMLLPWFAPVEISMSIPAGSPDLLAQAHLTKNN